MRKSIGILALLFMWSASNLYAQFQFEETIKKTIEVTSEDSEFNVKNVFGSIEIEAHSQNTIVFEVERKIIGKSKEGLELGKEELQVKIFKTGDKIIVHPDAPYITFQEQGLGFNWCNEYGKVDYEHELNFKIKVPNQLVVKASTVNDGEILVKNVKAKQLEVSNVNGGIALLNVTGATNLNCVNGDVSITYTENPNAASKYYALNGDMKISYQDNLSAQVSFKSMNGELYTDFDIEKQFTKTSKSAEPNKAKYKYESRPILQIGQGDIALDFETLNGNVYLKKI